MANAALTLEEMALAIQESMVSVIKQNELLIGRIEALESVLASILPEFNKDTIGEWLVKARNANLAYIEGNLPVTITGMVTINGSQLTGYAANGPTLSLTIMVGEKFSNASVKLPSYTIIAN